MFRTLTLAPAFVLALSAGAQQWQLVTPVKYRSELATVRMVDGVTGYTIDRALGFVLRTTDAGESWDRLPYNLTDHPKDLWMWDAQRGIIAASNGRFYRTDDGFNTLTIVFQPTFGNLSTLFFLDDTLGYAGSENGKILRTTDAGATWTPQITGTTNSIYTIFFADAQHGYASATGNILLRTTDGGDTWEPMTPPTVANIRAFHFFDAQHGIGVGHIGHIIRTDDGGDNWVLADSIPFTNLYDLEVLGNVLVAAGSNGVVARSTNGGDTWSSNFVGTRDHLCSSFTPGGTGLCTGDGTVYRSLDQGATWQLVQGGTAHTFLNKVSFGTEQVGATVGWITSGGYENALMRTTDGGRHWSGTGTTNGGWLGVHLRADGTGWQGGSQGANRRTTDSFATSTPCTAPNLAIRATWAFSATTAIVAGGYINGGMYRTTNSGASWDLAPVGSISIFDLYFPNDLVGYAGGEGGTLWKTTDGGINWNPLTSPTNGDIYSVFFLNDTLGYIAGASSAHRTTNGGASWTYLGGAPQYSMSIFFTDADTGYVVGSSGQALRTTDGGDNWQNIVPAPFDAQIGDATYVDGALVAVGRFGDVYRAPLQCPVSAAVPAVLQSGDVLCTAWRPQIQWYLNGEPLPADTVPCISPTEPGSYTVMITDALGCASAPSAPVQVINTAVPAPSLTNAMLAPNPASTTLTLTMADEFAQPAMLLDAQGRLVRRFTTAGRSTPIDVRDLSPGSYTLLVDGTRGQALRFVRIP